MSATSALPALVGEAGVAVEGDDFAAGVVQARSLSRESVRARAELYSGDAAVNDIIDALASRYRTAHVHTADDPGVLDPRMWSVDRLHPSELGHRRLANRCYDALFGYGLHAAPTRHDHRRPARGVAVGSPALRPDSPATPAALASLPWPPR